MRVTVNLDADVLAGASSLAQERGVSLGAALSDLARLGLRAPTTATERRIPGFAVTPDSPQITPEMIRAANEDG